jgi:signal transduction histidine kinase
MTSTQPGPPRQRHTGTWLCVGAVTAYVLASPFFLRNTPDGATWVVLWIALGVLAIALVTAGVVLANRAGREHLDELHHLDAENADLSTLAETRRRALENLVDQQLPAIGNGHTPPGLPDPAGDDATSDLLGRAVAQLGRVREDQLAGREAVQAAVVSLGRKVQASAHRLQDEATKMVDRHPADPDVLATSMRIDHAAAQQARNAQSLVALCGEWPGQQWHQALPIADVVRGAAGRITAFQRVEVSGDPGVAVAAHVVEPLIHLIAELLANATQSSPPTTQVIVSLRHVQRGAVIEIDDGGVGLDDSRLEKIREIASGRRPVTLADLGEIPQTGLPVVGAYVRRHGFRVDITESVYGGLRAIVLVPAELTEPVAPAGLVAGGGHALTRRSERRSAPAPANEPLPEQAPGVLPELPQRVPAQEPEPASQARHELRVDQDEETAPASGELPVLPRRRSRRGEQAADRSTVDWPVAADVEPAQTAEQAGEWMGAFLSSNGELDPEQADRPEPHDHATYAEDTREEQR